MNPYQRRIRDALGKTRPDYATALDALSQAILDYERGLLSIDELLDIARETQP